jgi:hypothetical protein
MAGLGFALLAFIVLGIAGAIGDDGANVALVFVQFPALFVAGYVAGRLSPATPALDGGLAGLLVFFVSVGVSVAGGATLGIGSALFLGIVAAVLGSAGGALAQHRRR